MSLPVSVPPVPVKTKEGVIWQKATPILCSALPMEKRWVGRQGSRCTVDSFVREQRMVGEFI